MSHNQFIKIFQKEGKRDMNLENLKTSFGNVASAAGYDTEGLDAAGEKVQAVLTKGKA